MWAVTLIFDTKSVEICLLQPWLCYKHDRYNRVLTVNLNCPFTTIFVIITFVSVLAVDVSGLDGPLPRDVDVVAQDEGQGRAGVGGVQINWKQSCDFGLTKFDFRMTAILHFYTLQKTKRGN